MTVSRAWSDSGHHIIIHSLVKPLTRYRISFKALKRIILVFMQTAHSSPHMRPYAVKRRGIIVLHWRRFKTIQVIQRLV